MTVKTAKALNSSLFSTMKDVKNQTYCKHKLPNKQTKKSKSLITIAVKSRTRVTSLRDWLQKISFRTEHQNIIYSRRCIIYHTSILTSNLAFSRNTRHLPPTITWAQKYTPAVNSTPLYQQQVQQQHYNIAMDRTNEFFSYASTLPKPSTGNITAVGENRSNASSDDTDQLRNFHTTASGISGDIAGTSQLLAELTKLVRRRGLFTEEADNNKVNELIGVIKQNVQDLNMRLDDSAELIAAEKNKKMNYRKTSQPVQEASNLVGRLQEEFVQTTAGFKAVLQQRSDRMKENKDWKNKFHGNSNNASIHLGPKIQPGMNSRSMKFQPLNLGAPPSINSTPTSDSTLTPAGEVTSSLPRPREFHFHLV